VTWANFSIYKVLPLKEFAMNKLFYYISLIWLKNLREASKRRKERKKTEYYEKKWDMKLRGIK
jgi:hypothetical protein